jgi:subtilisin family serine protease
MKNPSRSLASLLALIAASAALGQGGPNLSNRFVEIPRKQEFRGVLTARPVKPETAKARGLSERQARERSQQALLSVSEYEIENYFGEVDEFLIKVPKGLTENDVAARLMATGNFEYVEPDWLVYPIGCPNDTSFSLQWHHAANRLDSCAAWDLETGDASVTVAICDTGIRTTHQDLLLNRKPGFNVATGVAIAESAGGAINDINGHGTNCTGSAAGNGNNGLGIAGVGWSLSHRMIRVTNSTDGSASISNLTLAARTAADAGDRVASVSYSGVNSSSVFSTGTYVRSKGAMLVWAAGNSNVSLSGNRNDNVLVVGATDQNDARASFSNYGSLVDVMAPGVSIRTTSNAGDTSYAAVSGTSFACPITAGLCGLIWSRNPTLTPAEVESIIRSTCQDLGTVGLDDTFGFGRIDSYAALAATPDPSGDTVPPANPTGLASTSGNAVVNLSWTASAEPDLAGYRVYRSTTSGSGYAEITSALVTATSYADTAVTNGTAYYYVIRAADTSGNLSGDSTQVAATPTAPPVFTLFADNFESGSLAAGGWSVQNSNSSVVSGSAFSSGFGGRVVQTGWIQRNVDTTGYGSIEFRFARRTAGMDGGERLYAEYWNGAGWVAVESTKSTAWASRAFVLPAAAANNPNFAIRFRTNCNLTNERADLDNVEVRGVALP